MKAVSVLLSLTMLLTGSAQAAGIIFEQETTRTKVTILDSGMSVDIGNITLIRPRLKMEQGRVRVGSTVITSDNRSGTVTGIFPNDNKIVVSDSYYGNRTWTLDKIAVTNGCSGAVCVNDNVVTSDNRSGRVVGYFNSGNIVVYDSYYENRTWDSSKVAFAFGCSGDFCAGDKVITTDNREGKISAFFPNGDVVVYDSYYENRTWSRSKIALTGAICTNIYIQRTEFCR